MNFAILDEYQRMNPQPQRRHDAVSLSSFVDNELKLVLTKTYDRRYPDLDAKMHIPIETLVGPGATSWAYDSFEHAGMAKWIGANPNDVPRVDVGKKRATFPVEDFGVAFAWTIKELAAAQFAGIPINEKKAATQRRVAAEFEHTKLLLGDVNVGIPGFLTNPAVPRISLPHNDWLGASTADEMVQDISYLADRPWLGTEFVEQANTILLPGEYMRAMQTRRIPDSNMTVMDFAKSVNPQITTWGILRELRTAGSAGGPMAVAYKKDPESVTGIIPQPFTTLPPEVRGFEVIVNGYESVGGVVFFYPRSAAYADLG